jgi:hypothetical protein
VRLSELIVPAVVIVVGLIPCEEGCGGQARIFASW